MAIASLNLPGYATPQALDFSPLAQLGQTYKTAQNDAIEQQTLASLGRGADGKIDTTPLINSGNLKLANLGISIEQRQQEQARQERQDQRQTSRDAVDDKFRGASLSLQERAAKRAEEDKYLVKEVTDANGNTTLVRVNTKGSEGPINTGLPAPSAPNNPFSSGGKFNGDQGKAAGFTDRMLQSEAVLSGTPDTKGVESVGKDVTQTGLSKLPVVGNYLVSNDRQKYQQAKADFINAQLRRESGAAIAPSEFESADKQYFPIPGDGPDVIKQKAANRRAAVEAMGREGGASYRPKSNFGADGRIVPNGMAEAQSAPKPGQMMQGYRFKGGDPADQNNWVKAQ